MQSLIKQPTSRFCLKVNFWPVVRSVGGTRGGGYKWQQEARANENWPEKAAGYYNTKRNGTESNEATGKKQSQSNQINANISLKNYESKIERAEGSEKEWVMKGGERREGGEAG